MSLPTPDYERGNVRLYRADCLDVLEWLDTSEYDAVVTDPVWPDAAVDLPGSEDPHRLLNHALLHLMGVVDRVVVQVGCDTDPRFLTAVPRYWPFFRASWLEYVRPHYKGRLLYTSDVAYVFGAPPRSKPGAHVLPGRCIQNDAARKPDGHPCPRQLQHVEWLVRWFVEDGAIDPFMGSGTTGVACVRLGKAFMGIEIDPSYFRVACERIDAAFEETALLDYASVEQADITEERGT